MGNLQGAQGTERCQGHSARTHRLCLPEGVHNGTPLLSHHTVVPQPGLGVDGLTHGPQHLQGLPAVPAERRGWQGLSRLWSWELLHSRACRNPWATQNGHSRYRSELSQHSPTGEERRPGSFWHLPLNPAVQSQHPPSPGTGTHFLTGSSPYFISSRMAVGAV